MNKFAGAAHRAFIIPTDLATAYAYYGDLRFVLNYLPLIDVVKVHDVDHFRMLYSSQELGTYTVRILCDIRATLDGGRHLIRIVPEEALPPVKSEASFYTTTGRGYFAMESLFSEIAQGTKIQFQLHLQARLPKPSGMRFMVGNVVNRIANGITNKRMSEIMDGFINDTTAAFPTWLAERERA